MMALLSLKATNPLPSHGIGIVLMSEVWRYSGILLGHHLCQIVKIKQCIGNHLWPYHQGSDVTGYLNCPHYLRSWNLPCFFICVSLDCLSILVTAYHQWFLKHWFLFDHFAWLMAWEGFIQWNVSCNKLSALIHSPDCQLCVTGIILRTVTNNKCKFPLLGLSDICNKARMNWDSSVCIAADYGLDDWMIGVWFLAGVWNFSLRHCVQTGSGAHPASCPMGIGGFFSGGKATGVWSWPLTSI
jgi:hypothetical protein